MRTQFLCTVSAAAVAVLAGGASFAADLPLRTRPEPVRAYVPTWAGPYAGIHAGYARSRHDYVGDDAESLPGSANTKLSGLAVGIHAGYNWQFNQWVFGVEGDATITPAEKQIQEINGVADTHIARRTDWLASIRGRLGMAFDRTLIYATGGVAWVGGKSTLGSSETHNTLSYIATGGVVGGGIEYKYNPYVSLRLEGLHYMFNHESVHSTQAMSGIDKIKTVDVIRAGITWHIAAQ